MSVVVQESIARSRFSYRRAWAIALHEFRILFKDPTFLVIMLGMPIVVMTFLSKVFRFALIGEGYTGATGAEHAVPGITVMFTFFMVGSVGFVFFREHGWGTWERLRASRARPLEIMAGKVTPVLAHAFVQQAILFSIGGLAFGLRVRGSIAALVIVAAALSICLVSMGTTLAAYTRTAAQQNAIANVGTMMFAGLGGAMAPISTLPGWVRSLAPATPSYWAMKGYRAVILDGAGLTDVLTPVLVLILFAAGFVLLSLRRFRFEETKVFFA